MTKKCVRNDEMSASPTTTLAPSHGRDRVEAVIFPCKEKVRLILDYCQDAVQKLDSIQARLEAGRSNQTPVIPDVGCSNAECLLLEEKLQNSMIRINELEAVETAMRIKISDMEENIQTMKAQLLIYKEDFDLERKDRENAQGRIADLEQQLLTLQSSFRRGHLPPSVERHSHHGHGHRCDHRFHTEGYDVCDAVQPLQDEHFRPHKQRASAPEMNGTAACQAPDLTVDSSSSEELIARSFNIQDFFRRSNIVENSALDNKPTAKIPIVMDEIRVGDGVSFADGIESPKNQPILTRTSFHEKKKGDDVYSTDYGSLNNKASWASDSWSLVKENQEGDVECLPVDSNLDRNRSLSPRLYSLHDNSMLKCPKCFKSFTFDKHLDFVDHLEEC